MKPRYGGNSISHRNIPRYFYLPEVRIQKLRNCLMMRFFKVFVLVFLVSLSSASARAGESKQGNGFSWERVMNAIIHLESKGNARAVNGQYVGVLQISPLLVKECNTILKERGSKKRYTLVDRFSPTKSKEMFVIIQSHHNPHNKVEKGIRLWAGGTNYSIKKTEGYLRRVLRMLD